MILLCSAAIIGLGVWCKHDEKLKRVSASVSCSDNIRQLVSKSGFDNFTKVEIDKKLETHDFDISSLPKISTSSSGDDVQH